MLFTTTPNSEHGHHLDCKFTSRCTHTPHTDNQSTICRLEHHGTWLEKLSPFPPQAYHSYTPFAFPPGLAAETPEVRLRGGTHIAFLGENAGLGHGVRGRVLIVWLVEEVGRLETT